MKELIRKYLNGDCSYEEEQRAIEFLSSKEGSKILNELADEFWQADIPKEKIDEKRLYQKITNQIPNRGTTKAWSYIGYAASLLIVAVAAYFIINNTEKGSQPHSVSITELVNKSTSKGQKSTIMLSDGSKVILNAQSTISYPKYFTDSSRQIELLGEAFFHVAKDKTRPFTVLSGTTKTTALGTSFNVNSRTAIQKISLATGKVLINAKNSEDSFILEPGEALQLNTQKGTAQKLDFDLKEDLLWKDGILYFNDTPFKQIVATLELWYDVSFDLGQSSKITELYTGQFDNASLEHVLDNMSFALDFEYYMQGKEISIIKTKN